VISRVSFRLLDEHQMTPGKEQALCWSLQYGLEKI
jgi:hypothetical protein